MENFIWLMTDEWRTFVNMVTNLRIPYNVGKLLTNFSRRTLLYEVK